MRKKLLVKRELFDKFQSLFTVYAEGTTAIGEMEEKPFLIPKRYFGGSGNIVIPMKIKFDSDWKSQAIMVQKDAYDEMLSYFHVYEGEFNVPMLRKVFEFPSEHLPGEEEAFKFVCHLYPDDTCDEPKLKSGGKDGYVIDL